MDDALHFHVRPTLNDASLVLAFDGFNDAGECATRALRYVSDAVRAVPLADLDPERFYDFTVHRPNVVLDAQKKRRVVWPGNHFYFGSLDEQREIVVGIGVEPHVQWRTFCDEILRLVRELEIRRVVLLGAYLSDVVYSRPVRVTGSASHEEDALRLSLEVSSYEGPTGIVGVLAERLRAEGVRSVSLWAGLPHYINASPNPRGAYALLQSLCELLDFKVDDEDLRAESSEFEEKISTLVSGDPDLSEYVKQLKRREFAQ